MASLLSGTTVDGSTVWHQGNDGTSSQLDARYIGGYDWTYMNIHVKGGQDQFSLTSGSSGIWYPITIKPDAWWQGITTLDLRRTSVHQDGGGAGAWFCRFRFRSTYWGHHQSFWELEENWGNGNYPFMANATNSGTSAYTAIWLRGGFTYYFKFDTNVAFEDTTTNTTKGTGYWEISNPNATITTTTTKSLPAQSSYIQRHWSSQGYSLGLSGYNWSNIYATTSNIGSDRRIKENFGLSFGLEFLMKLKPVSYQLKATGTPGEEASGGPDKRRKHGFIAQEVKEAMDELEIPEENFAGYEGRDPDHLYLSYEQFIPILVNAVQEQQSVIEDLKSRIKVLEGN